MQAGMPFKLLAIQGVDVVELTHRSMENANRLEELGRHLHDLADRQGCRRIILDFANVRFLASSVLGVIVALQQKLEYQEGKLALCGLHKELRQVFKFAQLDTMLTFHETRDDALAAFDTPETK